MGKHIGFFRNIIMFFSLSVMISCNEKKQALTTEKYYNFSCDTIKTDSSQQINSKFRNLESSYTEPYYSIEIKKKDSVVLKSYFVFNRIRYKTPASFKNFKEYGFSYSIMPKYIDSNLVAQKINFGNYYVYLIKGENPYCNGTNCRTYNLHLLVIKSNKLKYNLVYQFDSNDDKFEDFRLTFAKDKLLLLDSKTTIDTIIL